MSLLRLYTRVLELLGKEARLGWILAAANLLLAGAQFAEPVLFGRIVDVLSGKPSDGPLGSSSAWPLLAAWAAFGLFTIACSALVALHADRLAHRQRQAVLTDYFEHIMQLPLTFHTGTHSGRLMKVMLNGTDSLWRLWLAFFREHFAAIANATIVSSGRCALSSAVAANSRSTPAGSTFEHDGPHYPVRANPGLVEPVQPGGVPIIVGGYADARREPPDDAVRAFSELMEENRRPPRRRPLRRGAGALGWRAGDGRRAGRLERERGVRAAIRHR